jgi:fibronectin-binding autotransporter adhesin
MKVREVVLTFALLLAAVSIVSAATYYWDENGAAAGFGTAGSTWASPTPGGTYGWSTNSTGASTINSVTTTTSDSLYFGTDTTGLGSGTITLSGTRNAANLYFGKASGAITLSGGTVSFPNSGGYGYIQAASGSGSAGATHTINSDLQKTSGGIWFGRQNTAGEHYIVNGTISGTAYLELRPNNNAAYVALNGTNTFSGNVSLVTGQVNINNVANAGVAQSLGTGSIFSMGGGSGQQPLLWYTGTSAGSSDKTFRLNSTAWSRIVAQDGALDLSGSVTTLNTGTLPLHLSGTADSGTNRVSGVISDGSGTIRLQLSDTAPQGGSSEANFWALSGVNSFTGTTTLDNDSHLLIDGAGQLGEGSYAGTISINNSSTFEYGSSADQTLTGTVQGSGTGGLVASGSGLLIVPMGDTTTYTGPTTVDGGNLQFANTVDLKGLSCAQFYINDGGTLEFESSIGGNNRTVLNSKTFTFGSSGGGTLNFNNGNHLFQTESLYTHAINTSGGNTNTISSSNGGYMNMQGAGRITFNVTDGTGDVDLDFSGIFNNGKITKNGNGTLAITGTHNGSYPITITEGTLEVGGSATLAGGTFSSTIANTGTFVYASSADQTLAGAISGSGVVKKETDGSTLTLSGANSFSGGVKVGIQNGAAGGTVSIEDDTALGTGSFEFEAGGTLSLGTNGLSVGNLVRALNRTDTTARTVRLDIAGSNSGTLSGTVDIREYDAGLFVADVGTDDALTLSGTIENQASAGGAGITKTGDGTLIISGNNSYKGTTTISNGILKVTTTDALGSTSQGTVVADGGTLELGHSGNLADAITINGAGEGGIGAIYSTGGNADLGNTVTLGSDATIGCSTRIDQVSGTEITDGGNGYTLTKTGAASYVVSGSANFSHLVVNQGEYLATGNSAFPGDPGTVTVNASGNLGTWAARTIVNSPNITINDGGIFATSRSVLDSMSINGTITLNGNTTFKNGHMVSTINSVIGGTGNLSILNNGATDGSYIFTATNTYTGDTTITGVPLTIGGAGSLGSGSYAGAIVMNKALTYSSSADQTLSGNITGGANTLTKDTSAASTLTLTGTSTLEYLAVSAGTVDIAGGTLTVTGVTVAASSTLDLTGGTLDLTPVAQNNNSLQINGGGVVEISGGTHDLYGRIYNYGTFRVTGDAATIAIHQISNVGGTWEFVLDSDGVSTLVDDSWISLSGETINVDGSAYTGGDTEILLFDSSNLLTTSTVVNVTGFSSDYLYAIVTQDMDTDHVTLVINQRSASLFRFK